MKTVIIIPARYSSVRYPGKPLVKLSIGEGLQKSLIQLSWEAAIKVKNVDEVLKVALTKPLKRVEWVEVDQMGKKDKSKEELSTH